MIATNETGIQYFKLVRKIKTNHDNLSTVKTEKNHNPEKVLLPILILWRYPDAEGWYYQDIIKSRRK